ncbi:NUDIX domain-containing protein [Streptomyces sp. M10(2022)]
MLRYDNEEVGVHWAMPGGGMDPGETPLKAVERELREETGWTDIEIGTVFCLWEHDFTRAGVPVRQHEHIFLAHALAEIQSVTLPPRMRRTRSCAGDGGLRTIWPVKRSRCGRRSCRNCLPACGEMVRLGRRLTLAMSRTGPSAWADRPPSPRSPSGG